MDWQDGKLTTATVRSITGTGGRLRYRDRRLDLDLHPGGSIDFQMQ